MNYSKLRILIIDDEKALLKMLNLRLSRIGFIVEVAENGEDGMNKINSTLYDLIFTDIKMPGKSGDDVLNHVRTKVKKSTPVIAMSGTPWLTEKSNFDAVLAKPFSKEEMLDVIKRFVHDSTII